MNDGERPFVYSGIAFILVMFLIIAIELVVLL